MHQNSFFWHLSPREPLRSRMFTKGVCKEDETLVSLHLPFQGVFTLIFLLMSFCKGMGVSLAAVGVGAQCVSCGQAGKWEMQSLGGSEPSLPRLCFPSHRCPYGVQPWRSVKEV